MSNHKKAYLEITNRCNLSCAFCPGTTRPPKMLTSAEFDILASKLTPWAEYLYFHLMGEPLLHPSLGRFFEIAADLGFKVILTTNGTLLKEREAVLLSAPALHKVSISLHCYEVNSMGKSLDEYLGDCFDFCEKAADRGIYAVMRLWNIGGEDKLNQTILGAMHHRFDGQWEERYSGYRLAHRIFLEWGNRFDWPDINGEYKGDAHSCYGLRNQIGVLCDGTVVPCCLDAEGAIPLGNIFDADIQEILAAPRAINLKRSLENRRVCEELCRRCGYGMDNFK